MNSKFNFALHVDLAATLSPMIWLIRVRPFRAYDLLFQQGLPSLTYLTKLQLVQLIKPLATLPWISIATQQQTSLLKIYGHQNRDTQSTMIRNSGHTKISA
jgi:hypothetical protein